jgi:hypothetical protein
MIVLSGQLTSLTTTAAAAIALVLALEIGGRSASNDTPALSLRATVTSLPADPSAVASAKAEASAKVGAATTGALSITLSRWSTDAERAPLVAALAAPSPAPAQTAAPAGGGRAVGRGRGGRGAPPPPPPSPFARLSAAIKGAPTLGYIWTDGVTGYSIKYAWRSPATEDKERIVLVIERRLDSHLSDGALASGAAGDADFTVIELRIDRQGVGEGKTSLTTSVAIDTAASTLALEGYAGAPTWLKVTR